MAEVFVEGVLRHGHSLASVLREKEKLPDTTSQGRLDDLPQLARSSGVATIGSPCKISSVRSSKWEFRTYSGGGKL